MGRRNKRRKLTRREKIAAGLPKPASSSARIVAVGHRKPGQAEVVKIDFSTVSGIRAGAKRLVDEVFGAAS